MKKLIYFHGFGSSGEGNTVRTLREFLPDWEVIAPDIPVDPAEALPFLKTLVSNENPDIIVGTSMGGMYAQQMTGFKRICVNPAFDISKRVDILRVGTFDFFNTRKNGEKTFTITPEIIAHYAEMEAHQFDGYDKKDQRNVYGLFGSNDTVVNNLPLFKYYYNAVYVFDGEHRLSRENIKSDLMELIRYALHVGFTLYKPHGFRQDPAFPQINPVEERPQDASFLTKEELQKMASVVEKRDSMTPDEYRKEILYGIEQKFAWVATYYRPSTGHHWVEFSFTKPSDEDGDWNDYDRARIERLRYIKLSEVPTAFFKTLDSKTL